MKVLFLCKGNRGRSQMAEGYFRNFYPQHKVSSAGVNASKEKHLGEPVPYDIVKIMKDDGVDVSKQKIKAVTKEIVDSSDRIVVLCSKNICPKYVSDNDKVEFWDIDDPEGRGIDVGRRIKDLIKNKVKNMFG